MTAYRSPVCRCPVCAGFAETSLGETCEFCEDGFVLRASVAVIWARAARLGIHCEIRAPRMLADEPRAFAYDTTIDLPGRCETVWVEVYPRGHYTAEILAVYTGAAEAWGEPVPPAERLYQLLTPRQRAALTETANKTTADLLAA